MIIVCRSNENQHQLNENFTEAICNPLGIWEPNPKELCEFNSGIKFMVEQLLLLFIKTNLYRDSIHHNNNDKL